jgi:hypothetical protein
MLMYEYRLEIIYNSAVQTKCPCRHIRHFRGDRAFTVATVKRCML